MERMRTSVATIVLELRRTLKGEDEETPLTLVDQLIRSYAGYFVAAVDAEENVWGAASMCLVSLGVFCDVLDQLRNECEVAWGIGDAVEASRMELQMQIQDDNE